MKHNLSWRPLSGFRGGTWRQGKGPYNWLPWALDLNILSWFLRVTLGKLDNLLDS